MTAFAGSFAQVRVYDRMQNKQVDISLKNFPFVTGATVVCDMNVATSITVDFDAPFAEGKKILDSEYVINGEKPNLFALGNILGVRMGYIGMGPEMITPWYYGLMSQGGDGLELNPDGLSGSISCVAASNRVMYPLGDDVSIDGTPLQILLQLIKLLDCDADIKVDAAVQLIKAEHDKGPQLPPANVWDSIRYICFQYGLWFWYGIKETGGKSVPTISVFSAADLTTGAPSRAYVMRGKFDPNKNQWPIFNFGPTSNVATWDGAMPRMDGTGVRLMSLDEKTGQPKIDTVKAEDVTEQVVGPIPGPPADEGVDGLQTNKALAPGDAPALFTRPLSPKDVFSKMFLNARCIMGAPALDATISTLGVPMEFPGGIIKVLNCGRRFDGPYWVKKVTHTFAPGDFTSTLEIQRRGSFEQTGSKVVPKAGLSNETLTMTDVPDYGDPMPW